MLEIFTSFVMDFCLDNRNCEVWMKECVREEIAMMHEDFIFQYPFEQVKESAFESCKERARVTQF